MTRVLVVDDSAVDRRLVGGLLEQGGPFQVAYAADGAEALRAIEAQPPELVITDLLMPELDGLALVAAARERFPAVPVILMTSRGSEEVAVRALESGAASYVPKRILATDLVETVRKVLAAARHHLGQRRLMECITRNYMEFELENDGALFPPLVSYLQERVAEMQLCSPADQTRIGIALEEALSNALYHGNLELDSSLRDEGDGRYERLLEERRRAAPYAERRIRLEARLSRREAVFTVRDDGPGFDPARLPDPTSPENLDKASGRGILLMRTFMDEVDFNDRGTAVRMIKRGGPASPP